MRNVKSKLVTFTFILLLTFTIALWTPPNKVHAQTDSETTSTLVTSTKPHISTHLIETDTSYIYVTDVGNYTFYKATPSIVKYTSRNNNTFINMATFWINTTENKLPLPKSDVLEVVATNTCLLYTSPSPRDRG